VLNGGTLGAGKTAPLADGDRLEIGPYVVLASSVCAIADSGGKTVALRRKAEASDEKTVVLLGRRPAGPSAKPSAAQERPAAAVMAEKQPGVPVRTPASRAAPSSHALGVEFVRAFAEGAKIDPELLAGRTDMEFARELGGAMQRAMQAMAALSGSARELRALVGSHEKQRGPLLEEILPDGAASGLILKALFGAAGPGFRSAEQAVGDMADDLRAHDSALFHAMQSALFRLLNEISPMTIEAAAGSSALRRKRAKNWDHYAAKWESLSFARENGMLDVFLDYFRDAYDDRMGGL
jgi:type VI secretion system protein ImpI